MALRSAKYFVRSFSYFSPCRSIPLNYDLDVLAKKMCVANKIYKVPPARHSSYLNSKLAADVAEFPEFEVSKSPEEWKYVDRLLPRKTVPQPKPKSDYPSGWQPQSESAKSHQYFIKRTKNHMLPVYLYLGLRGQVKRTQVKHIQGDIWGLEEELKSFLVKENNNVLIQTQVHEVCGQINIRGDYVTQVRNWLLNKGF